MKKGIYLIFLLLIFNSCEKSINYDDLKDVDNVWMHKDQPYTGFVFNLVRGKKISSGKIFKGKKEGRWNERGTIIVHHGVYKNGLRDGKWLGKYKPDSTLGYIGSYKNNLKSGKWEGYHRNGKVQYGGYYKNGLKEDTWKYWYDNGILSDSGKYTNGIESGIWKFYNEDGSFKKEKVYN